MSSESLVPKRCSLCGCSQESKVTSTPQRKTADCPSPSLTSIACTVRTSASGESSASRERLISDNSIDQSSVSSEEKNIRAINKRGKFWRLFKPKSKTTLYSMIFSNPTSVEETVVELLSRYTSNPKFVIEAILKLFIDVCGYQQVNIEDIHQFEECDAKTTVQSLSNRQIDSELFKAEVFLMQECQNKNAAIIREGLYQFVHELILVSHHMGILYDDLFAVHIFDFIKCMAFSLIRPIRHTGIIFALKLMTALAEVYQKICWKLEGEHVTSTAFSHGQYIVRLKQYKHLIIKYINFSYLIFSKNCLIPDKKSHYVRSECAKEIKNWITHIPQFISERSCVSFLSKLMQDESNKVRLSALLTSKHLILAAKNYKGLEQQLKSIIHIIRARIFEVDLAIAAQTCDIFTELLGVYPQFVDGTSFKWILQLMFHEDYRLAEAAGRFTVTYARLESQEVSQLLCTIGKISGVPIFKDKLPLLVQALLDCTPELQDWGAYLSALSSDDVPLELKKLLMELFNELIQQLMNKSTRIRKNTSKSGNLSVSSNRSINIIDFIIPHMKKLLTFFEEVDECAVCVLKIVSVLDYSTERSNYNIHCNDIIKKIHSLLIKTYDINVIKNGIQALYHFYEGITDFRSRSLAFVRNLAQNFVTHYHLRREELHQDDLRDTTELSTLTLKLSCMFAFFDLTDFLKWEDIFDYWNFGVPTVAEHSIESSKHFLLWLMKNAIDEKDPINKLNEVRLEQLSDKCKEFIATCFFLLQKNTGASIEFVASESICNLLFTYQIHLEGPIKFNYSFKILMIRIEDEKYFKQMFKFLETHVLGNSRRTPKERQILIGKTFELFQGGILPVTYISDILKIFINHNEFDTMFNSMIQELQERDERALVVMILYTLQDSYSKILEKNQYIYVNSGEFESLSILAKKLSSMKQLKWKDLKDIVRLSMTYVFTNKHYPFLYLLKYFAKHLPIPVSEEVLEIFQKSVPEKDGQNDAILFFAKFLRESHQKPKQAKTLDKGNRKRYVEKKIMDNKKKDPKSKVSKPEYVNKSKQQIQSSETSTMSSFSVHDLSSDDLNISEDQSPEVN